MALTFAATRLTRDVSANRTHRATITPTGTNTAGGDVLSPSTLGLSTIDQLKVLSPASNGTLAFAVRWVPASGKVVFHGTNAVPGAAVGDPEVTAGTTLTGYAFEVEATGR